MAFLQRVRVLGTTLFPAQLVLFLALFAWHIQTVSPRCIFFAQNDLFLWNLHFFRDFLLVPGGFTAWLGELVLQSCHFGWPGTLAFTAIAWLIAITTMGYMRSISRSGTGVMWAVPAIVVLMAHGQYDYPLSVSIGAAFAMAAALGYVRSVAAWGEWRIMCFAGLCALLYYTAGPAFYVFASCAMIYEFYSPGRLWSKLALILGAVAARFAVPAILDTFEPGMSFLHIPPAAAYGKEWSTDTVAVAVYASFPLCALLLADRAARAQSPKEPSEASASGTETAPPESSRPRRKLRWTITTVLLLATAVLAGKVASHPNVKTVLALHDSADNQEWDEVLRLAARVPHDLYSAYVVHDVNLALCNTGRMAYDMFSYRQFGSPYLLESDVGPYTLSMINLDALTMRRLGEFHLQLGRVNDAEYYAHESYVRQPTAKCLRLLARAAVAKDQPEQARLFLNILRDDLIYGVWAEDWLTRLQQAREFHDDAQIDRIRSQEPAKEDIHETARFIPNTIIAGRSVSTQKQLASLLQQCPQNRMAFEFLMAVHLVNTDVGAVAGLLPKAADISYPATPPMYEEAAMISRRANKDEQDASDAPVVVNGCAISEETLNKIGRLDDAIASENLDAEEISKVAKQLGLAYFAFYYGRRGD